MKKISILMSGVLLGMIPSMAQFPGFSLKSNNQQLIEQSVKGALVKVTRAYELCDTVTGDRYGRNGNESFNEIPYLGIAAGDVVLVDASSNEPWVNDELFTKYKGKYRPIATATKVETLFAATDSVSTAKGIASDSCATRQGLVEVRGAVAASNSLACDTVSGDKEGWIVWVTSKDGSLDAGNLSFSVIRKTVGQDDGETAATVEGPKSDEAVMGGFYVVPEFQKPGNIELKIAAVVLRADDGWVLTFPFVGRTNTDDDSLTLTPVKDNKATENKNPKNKKKKS